MNEMARRSYGHGRWGAPYWFLGPEGVWLTVKIPIPRDGLKHDAILVEAN
jgi:hypothetical protein